MLEYPQAPGRHKPIAAQIDGGTVLIPQPNAARTDESKGKNLSWKAAKISLAHAQGSRTPVYGGGMAGGGINGGVEAAGQRGVDRNARECAGIENHQ